MLCPEGADLFICREFTALSLRKGFLERGCLFRTQLSRGLIFPGQLQEHAGKVILHFSGERAHGLDRLFKQFRHRGSFFEGTFPPPRSPLINGRCELLNS
jgi:hypothetical protein